MSRFSESPYLGGKRKPSPEAPSLKREWRHLRQLIELSVDCGDVDLVVERGKVATPFLIEVVCDRSRPDWERLHAALALGQIRDEAAVGPLASVLAREVARSDMLSLEVAAALKNIGTAEAIAAVKQVGLW